jgi:hypothetical protein
MPLWVAAIIGGLIQAVGTLVGRVLVSLGIGFVAYQGVDTAIGWAKENALQRLQALPPEVLQMVGLLQVGTCISILTSALIVRVTISGLVGGAKKMVVK